MVGTVRFASGAIASILVSNSQKPGIYAKVHVHGSNAYSAGVQTDGGAMFIAGRSGVAEPPYNDLWTIAGEEKMLEVWKMEDAAFFKTIDPVGYSSVSARELPKRLLNDTTPISSGQRSGDGEDHEDVKSGRTESLSVLALPYKSFGSSSTRETLVLLLL